MTNDIHIHHGIDYIEFGVTNMTESKRFYEAAFDWRFNDYGPAYAGIRKRRAPETLRKLRLFRPTPPLAETMIMAAITWNAFPSACSRVGRATALSLPDISIVSTGNSLETEGVY